MRRLLPILLLPLLMLACAASAPKLHAREAVRLTNGEWPPWLSQHLEHHGFVSRIVSEAFAREGVVVDYGFFPWKRAYEWAKDGAWDGSVVWSRTPEREQDFLYSDPVVLGEVVFFHRKDFAFDWETIQDIKGYRLGLTRGYTYGEKMDAAMEAGQVKVDIADSDETNFAKLIRGRIDLFAIDHDVGYDMLHRHFTPEEALSLAHHPRPLRVVGFHLIVSKAIADGPELIERFNKGLAQLRKEGLAERFRLEGIRGDYEKPYRGSTERATSPR